VAGLFTARFCVLMQKFYKFTPSFIINKLENREKNKTIHANSNDHILQKGVRGWISMDDTGLFVHKNRSVTIVFAQHWLNNTETLMPVP
jgi:hypothetical protein